MQAEGSITKLNFNQLKEVSGRLRRFLLGKDLLEREEPKRLHLLVVDDEESIRFSLTEYFSQRGFTVDAAHDLEEAETLIAKTNYEVVIQDLRLNFTRRNHGLEIIKLIHRRSPETRIVVLTSYGSTEIEAEARRSGADAFLYKPKPLSQVAQVVQGLIESSRKRGAPNN
jgi:DNA-binding NtrC family response regulator